MRKVLVVEDEASIRELIALNLQMAGWEVLEAENGERGLRRLKEEGPCDAAVLDVMLPGIDGFSLCESIRRDDQTRYGPRIHDLRHTFAVQRLTCWYREGRDVQALLPVLSTYLGHASIGGTSVYLTMTPALLEAAGARFEGYVAGKGDDR